MVWIESLRNPRTPKRDVIEVVIEDRNPEKPLTDEERRQIVEQDKTVNDEIPEDAKFLSAQNQKVKEQTRALQRGTFTNQAAQNLAEQRKKIEKPKERPQKLDNGLPTIEALKPKFDWDNLGPQSMERTTASQSDDYLKDVQTGMQTMLNTREFLYYSYYNRIKAQLKQYWEPKIKEKVKRIFAQGRQIASDQDRITKVIIHLNNAGILIRVQVVGESGVRDLDDAAVEAFRAAAPFPNPPKGIVDNDGTIKIRWDFILESASSQTPAQGKAKI
ncbi:MAG: energy transducer TonB [Bdellovibrionia bacterium]